MTATIALAGNPNVGKSTIFNTLTGSHQHVGNWPGKTVEKKEGRMRLGDEEILIVDLPGTYSLTAYSVEEIITRDYIINEHPTAVIAVVDASNLERNLYLVAQIMELDVPVIINLNMTDVAASRGLHIDIAQLSNSLGGMPVVSTVGNRSMGLDDLRRAIVQVGEQPQQRLPRARFEGILGTEHAALTAAVQAEDRLADRYRPRWLATKLLEDDPAVIEALEAAGLTDLLTAAAAAQARIEAATGEDAETLIADRRYAAVSAAVDAALVRPDESVRTTSDRIDAVLTHRIWGLPIFLLIMWVVFQFTANVSAPFLDWVDLFVNETMTGWATAVLDLLGMNGTWPADLILDGVMAGVGGVLVFVPVLLCLYLALAVLEDSGYMARAAFVMDRAMRWMGLHGKSFLPMIVGFGCTVPAVYATRTLENEKDRKLTAFLATFMSCGARLPVYVVVGAAFFGAAAGNLIFAMYLVGIAVALAVGFAFKHTVHRGTPPAPFVMELPPYRLPRPRDVMRQMWERTRSFLIKASTVIVGVSIAVWLLMAIPVGDVGAFNDVSPEDSLLGAVSGAVAPVFAPAGFGTWQATSSLLTGILAKELIVSTMAVIYTGEELAPSEATLSNDAGPASLLRDTGVAVVGFGKAALLTVQEVLNIVPRTFNLLPYVNVVEFDLFGGSDESEDISGLEGALTGAFSASAGSATRGAVAAVAFSVFVLLYVPCMAATAAMRQEFGVRWMWTQIGFTFALAWVAAVLVYQIGIRVV